MYVIQDISSMIIEHYCKM